MSTLGFAIRKVLARHQVANVAKSDRTQSTECARIWLAELSPAKAMLSDPYDIILKPAWWVRFPSLKNTRADGVVQYGHLDLRVLAQ